MESLRERTATYTRAYNVFYKLWEDQWGPWLQLILQNVLWAFIENQDYTLAEIPLFLNPRNTAFRQHIIDNIKFNDAVADFWRYEFFERREQEQQARVDAALTRLNTLLTHPYIREIVGQQSRLNFEQIVSDKFIILFRLSANLAPDIKQFVGTMLMSELLHAVRARREGARDQFCLFIDEFQNFATNEDMALMITEGRKFGLASTFLHVERFGQLAHNQKLMGATAAIVNKMFFQTIVRDAEEFAPEFAKMVEPTERRREAEIVFSPRPIDEIWDKGHRNSIVTQTSSQYFWIVEELRRNSREERVLFNPSRAPKPKELMYRGDLNWGYFDDWESYAASTEMLRQGLAALNRHYYWWMTEEVKNLDLVGKDDICERALEIVECLGGVYGIRPSMEPYISEPMRHALCEALRRYLPNADNIYPNVVTLDDRINQDLRNQNASSRNDSNINYVTMEELQKRTLIGKEVKKVLERPDFPRFLLPLEPTYPLEQLDRLQWHPGHQLTEDDFYKRLKLLLRILGITAKNPHPRFTQLSMSGFFNDDFPTTFIDLAHLQGIRQLAIYIGMSERDVENLISWRPRPLDNTERELFTTSYIMTAPKQLKKHMLRGEAEQSVTDRNAKAWSAYYADRKKMSQQVIDVNREDVSERIYLKMLERTAYSYNECLYFIFQCFWASGDCVYFDPAKNPSANYTETLRVERPQHDLVTDMVLDLSRLPRFHAAAKITQEKDDRQTVQTHKLQTNPLPKIENPQGEIDAIDNAHLTSKERGQIKEEIRKRQSPWRDGGQTPPDTRERR